MEEMYGLTNFQQGGVQQDNYQPRTMLGSGSNIQTTSSNDKQQNNNELAEELEDDLLKENRAKILSHPLYPKLLQVYIACQKVCVRERYLYYVSFGLVFFFFVCVF